MGRRLHALAAAVVVVGIAPAPASAGLARMYTVGGEADVLRRVQVSPPHDGAAATAVNLGGIDVAVAAGGALVVAADDVWRIGLDGRLWRLAGTGHRGFAGDGGPARAARVSASGVAVTPEGEILIAESANHRVRMVWLDGTITTVAGSGPVTPDAGGFSGDGGPATSARLSSPRDVAALPDGGFLIADTGNHRIRRVWPDGTITTVAGSTAVDKPRGLGDGGPAIAASLDTPSGVAVTPDGGFVIADTYNHRVGRVGPDGVIRTVAGANDGSTSGFRGDGGPATAALLDFPRGVDVSAAGELLIADASNDRIRRVELDGRIATVAGSSRDLESSASVEGDGGPALGASLEGPSGVAATPDGSLAIAAGNAVRFVAQASTSRPAVALLGRQGRAAAGGYRARVITSVPAQVTLRARIRGAIVRAHTQTSAGSAATITLHHSFPPGVRTVAVTATTDTNAVVTHSLRLILGGVLPARVAKDAIAQLSLGTEGTVAEVTRCRRLGPRRVDCEADERVDEEGAPPATCAVLVSAQLTASGLLRGRFYGCSSRPHPLFRQHPKWAGSPFWLEIPSR
jgi:hypothetical protein